MQTSLMEKESDSHKLYLSKTVENRIDDFRRFFYTNHERRCCMDEKELIRNAYRKMYDGMIAKDEGTLREVLDDSFVLVHMTGMRQPKEEFIKAVLNGTLNYYSAEHENLPVEISRDTAVLIGQSYVAAAVFGGGRSNWHLQQKCSLKKINGDWKITRSVASTY